MNRWPLGVAVILMIGMGGWLIKAEAQVISNQSKDANARHRIVTHDFVVHAIDYRVFVSVDRHTGKTWRFHAGTLKWMAISEPEKGAPGSNGNQRYDIFIHEFVRSGDEKEFVLRVDRFSGKTWIYNGNYRSWRTLE